MDKGDSLRISAVSGVAAAGEDLKALTVARPCSACVETASAADQKSRPSEAYSDCRNLKKLA